jgi:RNA polymerase sigma factor (sigma-70 family)
VYYFDELIITELRKNNNRVLGELYKTHYPMILNLVMTNQGTEQEARDVFQEAVIAFYERARQPGFVLTCKVKTYLYAVCRRLWLKRLYEKKRYPMRIEEIETFLQVEDEIAYIEEQEKKMNAVKESVQGLGEPCNSIIRDFYFNNLTMDQIRDKFNYTNSDNAKNQKYKCLQRLKKIFFEGYKP